MSIRLMDDEMERGIMQRAIDRYGVQAQSDQCVQECAELTQAIMKIRQLSIASHTEQVAALENIIEEIADVGIMIDQMRMIYGAADVDAARERKLVRLAQRLDALDAPDGSEPT